MNPQGSSVAFVSGQANRFTIVSLPPLELIDNQALIQSKWSKQWLQLKYLLAMHIKNHDEPSYEKLLKDNPSLQIVLRKLMATNEELKAYLGYLFRDFPS